MTFFALKKFEKRNWLGMGIEPGSAEWESSTLPLCYSALMNFELWEVKWLWKCAWKRDFGSALEKATFVLKEKWLWKCALEKATFVLYSKVTVEVLEKAWNVRLKKRRFVFEMKLENKELIPLAIALKCAWKSDVRFEMLKSNFSLRRN